MSRRTFKHRLYPNRQQREKLEATLDVCRELYNAGLQERREAWSSHRKSIGYLAPANQLGEIKDLRDDLRAVHSQALQDVLRRLGKTLSDGTEFENPRLFQKMRKHLRRVQRRVTRRKKFSKRWKKAMRMVAKIHRKVFNQRSDFQHQLSRDLVNNDGTIVVEDLNVRGLSRGRLSKSVHDAGWAAFFLKLVYKAESAGRQFLSVDARGTSQRCPCGEPNIKLLVNREHVCVKCGLITTRDHASAMEILRLGLSLQSLTAA